MAGISFFTDPRGDKIVLKLSPRKNGQQVSIQPLRPSPKFHIGVMALVLREIEKNNNPRYKPPLESILRDAQLLLYLYPEETRPSRELRRIKDSIRKAWQEAGRLTTIYESPQNYLLHCGAHKREYQRLSQREGQEVRETLEKLFHYDAETRKRTLLGLGLEHFGLGIDDVKIEGLTELLDQCKRKERQAMEAVVEQAPHHEMNWKELCLKMKGLKNSSVFGKFPLDKIFIEPRLRNKPAFAFLDEALKENRIVIILNEFGMGKSSLCKEYASFIANRYLKDVSGRENIPLFIKLGDFFTSDVDEKQLLRSYIEKEYRFLPRDDFLLNQSFCFVADAFDEAERYGEEEIKTKFKRLTDLIRYRKNSKMIITSRPGVFSHLSEMAKRKILQRRDITYTAIQDFSREEINKWLENWHEISRKRISDSDIEAKDLKDLARNPLLLYIIANVYDELAKKKKYKKAEVYRRFMEKTIRAKFEEDEQSDSYPGFCFRDEEEYEEVLQEIACHIFLTDKAISFEELANLLESKFNKSEDKRDAARSAIVCHFFREIQSGTYDFAHRTFMEFLNAQRIFHILLSVIKGQHDSVEAKFNLCSRPVTQPILDFLKELIGLMREEKRLSQQTIRDLCSVLREWYSSDYSLYASPRLRRLGNVGYVYLPRDADKSFNIRVLSLIIFVYLSSVIQNVPRVENQKFSIANFFNECKTDNELWRLLANNLSMVNLRETGLDGAQLRGFNLERANLQRASLRRADLQTVHLIEARVQQANLEGANLKEANLERANLDRTHLQRAYLERAFLEEAILTRADLREANLREACLREASLQGANLSKSNISRVCFWLANLTEANLMEANVRESDLEDTALIGASLAGARLENTCLRHANLDRACIVEAHLQGANLEGANLRKAELSGVKLERASLVSAQCAGIVGWSTITNFEEVDITGVQGLSIEQIKYALERGAITRKT